jgi:undecaprenyl pyrophosphate synthase
MQRKRETNEALKISKKKKKKNGTHEGSKVLNKKRRGEIAHTSKEIIKKRKSHDQGSTKILELRITSYDTHLHILIKVYDLHLLGSGF